MNITKSKQIFIAILISILLLISYFFFFTENNQPLGKNIISKVLKIEPTYNSELKNEEIVNILLIGKDIGRERKSTGQTGYNTDILILLSINPKDKRASLTSFPRDIWQNGGKINSILATQGMEQLLDAISKISGQKVNKYISIDFDGIRWLVDAFGGVPVEVITSFTDNSFPDLYDTRTMTVNFSQGIEIMNGDRALTFARSRKGNNGEGSDLMRAKRQHQILKGMIKSVENEKSIFFPFDIKEFYTEVILHTETNVSLDDAAYIFSFYKNINDYNIKSLVLDDRYIYHPENSAPFGGAWVFIAKDFNFSTLHQDLENFLIQGVDLDSVQTPTQPEK